MQRVFLIHCLTREEWKNIMKVEIQTAQKKSDMGHGGFSKGKDTCGIQVGVYYKNKVDGTTNKYKATLAMKWYIQTSRIDYHETFAPVAKMNIMLVLQHLAANFDWQLQQFDVKNVFLHSLSFTFTLIYVAT